MKNQDDNNLEAKLRRIAELARKQAKDEIAKHGDALFNSMFSDVKDGPSAIDAAPNATAERILAYLEGKEPQTITQLGKAMGLPTDEIRPVIKALHRSGKLIKSGSSRGTRYSINPQPPSQTTALNAA